MYNMEKLISIAVQRFRMIGKNEKKKTARKQLYVSTCVLLQSVSNVAGTQMAVKVWESMLVECVDRFEICT